MDEAPRVLNGAESPLEVEYIGTSSNSARKRTAPESGAETALFIKRRAVKVKPSARKIEDDLISDSPKEATEKDLGISIKGIASNSISETTQVEYTAPPQIITSVPTKQTGTHAEGNDLLVQQPALVRRIASPEVTEYIPPIDFKSFPRSSLVPPRSQHPPLLPCRSVYEYTRLNRIEEGTYGIVSRARCNATGGIYALKKLKLEEEKAGFPITSLREVMALMTTGAHENVVGVREIVVGDSLDQYVACRISRFQNA
jgi:hypothetical protein